MKNFKIFFYACLFTSISFLACQKDQIEMSQLKESLDDAPPPAAILFSKEDIQTFEAKGGKPAEFSVELYEKEMLNTEMNEPVLQFRNSSGNCTEDGETLLNLNFRDFALGNISPQSPYLRKWNPEAIYDGEVVGIQNGNKYLMIDHKPNTSDTDQPDVLLTLGKRTRGHYTIDMSMWVSFNESAYFNTQKRLSRNNVNNEFGAQVFFYSQGRGRVHVGGRLLPFTYPYNEWMNIVLDVDLDDNRTQLKINERLIASWLCTDTPNGRNGSRQFEGIDYYAWTGNTRYFIRDICYGQKKEFSSQSELGMITDLTQKTIGQLPLDFGDIIGYLEYYNKIIYVDQANANTFKDELKVEEITDNHWLVTIDGKEEEYVVLPITEFVPSIAIRPKNIMTIKNYDCTSTRPDECIKVLNRSGKWYEIPEQESYCRYKESAICTYIAKEVKDVRVYTNKNCNGTYTTDTRLLPVCFTAQTSNESEGEQGCSFVKEIFRNPYRVPYEVLISATDKCNQFGSSIEIIDEFGTRMEQYTIEDQKQFNLYVAIPPRGEVKLFCNGLSGNGCDFQVIPKSDIGQREIELSSSVTCRESREIFNNTTTGPVSLYISANDNCFSAASTIEIINLDGSRTIPPVLFDEGSPLNDRSFVVPSGGKVMLFCDGSGANSSGCPYIIKL